MALEQNIEILNGPSKWDLSIGLFDYSARRQVFFELNHPIRTKIGVRITCVQVEDGSGESWNIKGTIVTVDRPKNGDIRFAGPIVGGHVRIYFRTDNRRGRAQIPWGLVREEIQ